MFVGGIFFHVFGLYIENIKILRKFDSWHSSDVHTAFKFIKASLHYFWIMHSNENRPQTSSIYLFTYSTLHRVRYSNKLKIINMHNLYTCCTGSAYCTLRVLLLLRLDRKKLNLALSKSCFGFDLILFWFIYLYSVMFLIITS